MYVKVLLEITDYSISEMTDLMCFLQKEPVLKTEGKGVIIENPENIEKRKRGRPPKVESKVESKIEPKVEPKAELKPELDIEDDDPDFSVDGDEDEPPAEVKKTLTSALLALRDADTEKYKELINRFKFRSFQSTPLSTATQRVMRREAEKILNGLTK
jgi:hypothetical protein